MRKVLRCGGSAARQCQAPDCIKCAPSEQELRLMVRAGDMAGDCCQAAQPPSGTGFMGGREGLRGPHVSQVPWTRPALTERRLSGQPGKRLKGCRPSVAPLACGTSCPGSHSSWRHGPSPAAARADQQGVQRSGGGPAVPPPAALAGGGGQQARQPHQPRAPRAAAACAGSGSLGTEAAAGGGRCALPHAAAAGAVGVLWPVERHDAVDEAAVQGLGNHVAQIWE